MLNKDSLVSLRGMASSNIGFGEDVRTERLPAESIY